MVEMRSPMSTVLGDGAQKACVLVGSVRSVESAETLGASGEPQCSGRWQARWCNSQQTDGGEG